MKAFAYRVFDLRDRFDSPFSTVLEALEALYSEQAYMPEESGELVAYFSGNRQLNVPSEFFTIRKPRFNNEEEAIEWLNKRNKAVEADNRRLLMGIVVANPGDPFGKQLADAMSFKDVELNREKTLERISEEIEVWIEGNQHLIT